MKRSLQFWFRQKYNPSLPTSINRYFGVFYTNKCTNDKKNICKKVSDWIHLLRMTTNTFIRSSDFDEWLSGLTDHKAKARILARLQSAKFGNFSDCETVGEGVSEMRIHIGAGYRIYFTRSGKIIYFLLAGGDKSTQKKDIARAKKLAHERRKSKQ